MTEIGVNPGEAVTTGRTAGTLAQSFSGLSTMFTSAVDSAYLFAMESPVMAGYAEFGEENATNMAKVRAHGEALSGNIEAGGADGGATDKKIEEQYQGVRELLLRDLNYELTRE
ncbi:hypothetical protein OHR68_36150 [Spirillospora sp. NBC_00431]